MTEPFAQKRSRVAWRRAIARIFGGGSVAGVFLALLIAGPLTASPLIGAPDCGVDARSAYCQPKDKAREKTKDKAKPRPQREAADAQLLKSAFGRLARQRDGVTDLYTIGVSGWA